MLDTSILILVSIATVQMTSAPIENQHASERQQQSSTVESVTPMHHRFDGDSEFWAKRFDDPSRDAWQMPARVIAVLALQPGELIADIGAGTGYFAIRLAKAQPRATVYAADAEPQMVAHIEKRSAAERLSNVVSVEASATSPNLPQPVDLVLMVDTYHHLADRVAYFRELRGALRPGARLAIVDHRKESLGPSAPFRLTLEQIEGEMRQAGYRLDARHDFLPRQHFLVFRIAG